MQTLSVKILRNDENGRTKTSHIIDDFNHILKNGIEYSINYHGSLTVESVKKALTDNFGDIECRDGVYDGCYGASSGKPLEGFKVYIDSSLFPDRFLDSDFDEVINIEQLCNEFGTKLDIDPDAFRDSMAVMNIEGKSDNTYNYLGHDSYTPVPLCHANFEMFQTENEDEPVTIIVKFHCGGDIRGNYSSEVVYRFDDIYEAYNAFNPSLHIIDEDNLEKINELKDLISGNPEDKKLLIKELKELLGD
jgi:hypothetical protein